jgi:hypothetical protein
LCLAGIGAGSARADGVPTHPQLSLNDQRLVCPRAVWGYGAEAPPIRGNLRTAVWTVVEGDTGSYPDLVGVVTHPDSQVTPVVAQMPYAVTGEMPESRRVGQLKPIAATHPGGAAGGGEGEQPQGLPRAVFAALIALIGIVAVARRGMSHKQ